MTKDKKWWVQQGDCALKPAELPAGKMEVLKTRALIESAVTSHTHAAVGGGKFVRVLKFGNVLYVEAKRPFTLEHEEHKPIAIPKGTYRVDNIQEYDHFTEEARRVAD